MILNRKWCDTAADAIAPTISTKNYAVNTYVNVRTHTHKMIY